MDKLDDWVGDVCAALGLDRADLDTTVVLDLAREVAHGVARPAAPLTAYLLGLAIGRGARPAAAAATITDLVATRSPDPPL